MGRLTIRTAKEKKPWKAPGSSPYLVFHKAKSLANSMGVKPTIQTVKNLEVEVRKNEGEELYKDTPAIQSTECTFEENWQAYSDDDEPILGRAPASRAPTLEPAPAIPVDDMDTDDDDLFADPTPLQKEIARAKQVRDIYNGRCPPSPIAPIIRPTLQDEMDQRAWAERQRYDEQKLFNDNTSWLYVPSFPLRANITLIDPSSVDLLEDPVDSHIITCTCTNKIESVECDLFSRCAKCETKPNKWTREMDDGLWCFHGFYKSY